MKLKKGAMFGLDARIALAIFGALSVISGAALYSAIQQSKSIQYITQLQEVSKALEALILDVGFSLPVDDSFDSFIKMSSFVEESSLIGWKGPYLQFSINDYVDLNPGGNRLDFLLGNMVVQKISDDAWTSSPAAHVYCNGSNDCFYWAGICSDQSSALSIFKDADLYFDNSDTPTTGNLRYLSWSSTSNCMYLKSLLIK
jgi:hypothetical protein